MKNTLLGELIVAGATRRLEELNKESLRLRKIIETYTSNPLTLRITAPLKKKLHWTQTARGRKIMSQRMQSRMKAKHGRRS